MEVCLGLIESAKVEVELAAIMKGSLEVPFIEMQSSERLPSTASTSEPSINTETEPGKAITPLDAGPSANHPWRGVHVHRLGR